MFAFVVGGFFLCGLAVSFVLWPLRSTDDKPGQDHAEVVRTLYSDRLREVSTESDDTDLQEELVAELGAVLLLDQPVRVGSEQKQQARRGYLAWIVFAVPVLAIVVYSQVSDFSLLSMRGAEVVLTTSEENVAELESWRRRLVARVAARPHEDMSWYLLGHADLKLGQFASAVEAFATANEIAGDELNILLFWLQARYLNARGMFDDVSHNIANKLLAEHANFPVVLEMLALDAFRRGNYEVSIVYLTRAQRSTADPLQQNVFATAIEQVRNNMQEQPIGVTVDVSVRSKVPALASIFVIARPVGGGMPYAVVRRPALAIPFTARLDDLVAMSEDRLLSAVESFEVIVRLSLSNSAQAETGDWQWRSDELSLRNGEVPVLRARLAPPAPL